MRRVKAEDAVTIKVPAANSGAKAVGICVKLYNETFHAPAGMKWRYALVLGEQMLEIMDAAGAVVFQAPRAQVLSVSGPGYTAPLWVSREYPTPHGE